MLKTFRLSVEDAHVGFEAARRKSAEIGVPMDIAIVDDSGNLITFERMDGALIGCIQIAIDKAYTAAVLAIRTEEEGKIAQPGGPDFGIHTSHGGRIMIFGGGIPVRLGKIVMGAVGCSSGTVEQDQEVAGAAAVAIEKSLALQAAVLQDQSRNRA